MGSLDNLQDQVKRAFESGAPLTIEGGASRSFLGYAPPVDQEVLSTISHEGIVDYRPEELMLRAKSGTRLSDIIALLAENDQILGFEPPDFGGSTLGGVIATGISGSRRPYLGAVRDHVLGIGLILQDGSYAEFGGQVMKNVAGYDVSRLVCGSFGSLGVVADISLKTYPAPKSEVTLQFELPIDVARERYLQWLRKGISLSACCYLDGSMSVRLSGNILTSQVTSLGGDEVSSSIWSMLDRMEHSLFQNASDVWRLSTSIDEPLGDNCQIIDWGFAQRWCLDPDEDPRAHYNGEGHWTRIRADNTKHDAAVFDNLPAPLMQLHKRLKQTFDSKGVFNPGRMYPDF